MALDWIILKLQFFTPCAKIEDKPFFFCCILMKFYDLMHFVSAVEYFFDQMDVIIGKKSFNFFVGLRAHRIF